MIESLGQVFALSWNHTFKKERIKWFLGSFTGVTGLLLLGKSQFGLTLVESILWGVGALTAFLVLIYLYFFLKFGTRFVILKYRESVYGSILIEQIAIIAKVNLAKRQSTLNEANFKAILLEVCNDLKNIFERKNARTKCSVSFKALKLPPSQKPGAETEVFCLCRDKTAADVRHTPTYMATTHQVFTNTCYNSILVNLTHSKESRHYYLNNNVPATRVTGDSSSTNYMNTSYDVYSTLPYKSELVVPILGLKPDQDKVYNLSGFLCVDSDKEGSFEGRYDLAILQGIADSIYDLFVAFYANNQPNHEQQHTSNQ